MSNEQPDDGLEEIYDPETAAWVRANCTWDPTVIQELVKAHRAQAQQNSNGN